MKILDELLTECMLGRLAGPFSRPPMSNLQISPIGAVPNKHSEKLRMIHHQSYPRDGSGTSINEQIEDSVCEYLAFDRAIDIIRSAGRNSFLSKFDINSVFRYIRIRPDPQVALGICFKGVYFFER
jgi:hypothetical protein